MHHRGELFGRAVLEGGGVDFFGGGGHVVESVRLGACRPGLAILPGSTRQFAANVILPCAPGAQRLQWLRHASRRT